MSMVWLSSEAAKLGIACMANEEVCSEGREMMRISGIMLDREKYIGQKRGWGRGKGEGGLGKQKNAN